MTQALILDRLASHQLTRDLTLHGTYAYRIGLLRHSCMPHGAGLKGRKARSDAGCRSKLEAIAQSHPSRSSSLLHSSPDTARAAGISGTALVRDRASSCSSIVRLNDGGVPERNCRNGGDDDANKRSDTSEPPNISARYNHTDRVSA